MGVGIVVMEVPNEGMVYVYPRLENELWFGGTDFVKGVMKIIEGDDDDKLAQIISESEKMHVLGRGARGFKDYFNYEPGDEVVYLRTTKKSLQHNEAGEEEVGGGEYFVIGSWFDNRDEKRKPPSAGFGERVFEFPDGTRFAYDRNSQTFGMDFKDKCYLRYYADEGELLIKVKGDIKIEGSEIHLN